MGPDILARYRTGGLFPRVYRRLRLAFGGLRALAAELPAEGLVVDLGAGEGLLAHLCADRGARVLAIDHDPARVARLEASAKDLAIEARCADFATFAIPPCDGAALVDVLHYLDAASQERLLDLAAASLRPGGVLVLRDPDASGGWRFRLARLHERLFLALGWTRATLGRFRPGEEWADLLRARGLAADLRPLRGIYADRVVIGRKG
jgi:SAM-dependent methyltransferase